MYALQFYLVATKIWSDNIKALGVSQLSGLKRTLLQLLNKSVLQLCVAALFYSDNSRNIHPRGVRACPHKDLKERVVACWGQWWGWGAAGAGPYPPLAPLVNLPCPFGSSPPCPCPVLCINVGRPEPALCHPSAVAGSLCEAGTSRGPGPDSAQLP